MKHLIQTHRLQLTPIAISDLDIFFQLLRNEYVKRYLCDNRDLERGFVHSILCQSDALFEAEDLGLWWIRKQAGDQPAGFCGVSKNEAGQPEILYALHPDLLGHGYATEAAEAVVGYFTARYPGRTLRAKIDEPNIASHRVAGRLGFRPVDREWNEVLGCDMVVYVRNEE